MCHVEIDLFTLGSTPQLFQPQKHHNYRIQSSIFDKSVLDFQVVPLFVVQNFKYLNQKNYASPLLEL